MPQPVSTQFLDRFPKNFFVALVRVIRAAYAAAQRQTTDIDENVKPSVSGVYRWGFIETHSFQLAQEYGLQPDWRPNRTCSAFHVEIRQNEFVITIAKTEEQGKLPLDAIFRETLLESTQLRLLPEPIPTNRYILALIVHGPDEHANTPRFIDVLFPDPDGIIVDRIDLLDLAKAASPSQVKEEVIEDKTKPRLRSIPKVAGDEHSEDSTDLDRKNSE